MTWARWTLLLAASIVAGFMVVDGSRALLLGDYFTPRSGEYAGQLGPWSDLVAAVGFDPRSAQIKTTFVVYGVVWLVVIALFVRRVRWAWWGMLGAAIGSLWYLPFGTLLGALQIGLLFRLRSKYFAGS